MLQYPPAEPGMLEMDIETPALILDLDAFEANLETMAKSVDRYSIALRPHAKTHKSTVIANLQLRKGAIGQCVQKIAEAEVMAWGGIPDILITNEIVDPRKLKRLAALSTIAKVAVSVDSLRQIESIETIARHAGVRTPLLLEIDVGARRCGIVPGADAVALVKRINQSRNLVFSGLQAYHGPAQHLRTATERHAAIADSTRLCQMTVDALAKARITCDVVSGAGTGTFDLESASGVYTEIQVGTYCFMDGDYAQNLGEDGLPYNRFNHALFVLSSVISTTKLGLAVLDAGHKAITIERGLPSVWGHSDYKISSVSDEHARMEYGSSRAAPVEGEKFRLVPRNCDPTVDRFDWYVCVRKGRVESIWPVSARGGVQ